MYGKGRRRGPREEAQGERRSSSPQFPVSRSMLSSTSRFWRSRKIEAATSAPGPLESEQTVSCRNVALDCDFVPGLRVADVVDRHFVVPAPEVGDIRVALAKADQIARRRLSLPLGDHPMLDPDGVAPAQVQIAGDVARGEYPRRARLQVRVDDDAPVDPQAGRLGAALGEPERASRSRTPCRRALRPSMCRWGRTPGARSALPVRRLKQA